MSRPKKVKIYSSLKPRIRPGGAREAVLTRKYNCCPPQLFVAFDSGIIDDYEQGPAGSKWLTPGLWAREPCRYGRMDMRIRFGDRNADREAVINFLSGLWNLVDNQSRLKWQIVACCQHSNVQVGGVKFDFGFFITQSFDRRNLGSSRPCVALILHVPAER